MSNNKRLETQKETAHDIETDTINVIWVFTKLSIRFPAAAAGIFAAMLSDLINYPKTCNFKIKNFIYLQPSKFGYGCVNGIHQTLKSKLESNEIPGLRDAIKQNKTNIARKIIDKYALETFFKVWQDFLNLEPEIKSTDYTILDTIEEYMNSSISSRKAVLIYNDSFWTEELYKEMPKSIPSIYLTMGHGTHKSQLNVQQSSIMYLVEELAPDSEFIEISRDSNSFKTFLSPVIYPHYWGLKNRHKSADLNTSEIQEYDVIKIFTGSKGDRISDKELKSVIIPILLTENVIWSFIGITKESLMNRISVFNPNKASQQIISNKIKCSIFLEWPALKEFILHQHILYKGDTPGLGALSSLSSCLGLPVVHYLGSDAVRVFGYENLCKNHIEALSLLRTIIRNSKARLDLATQQLDKVILQNDAWQHRFLKCIDKMAMSGNKLIS